MLDGRRSLAAAAFIIIGLIIGVAISSNFSISSQSKAAETKVSDEAIDILSRTNKATAEVVAAVKPSVVNISSTKTLRSGGIQSPFLNDPFFNRFFGDLFRNSEKQRERKQSGMGSGVIVDRRGYILTNNHVINNADEIKVTLADKREFKGKVIGTDQKTDLAVVKIDSDNLPVIKLGDSEKLQIGETVFAIGNPFGLSQTVTSGIVSATGRANVGIADYEDFIQTDAPINPGNSGGALVNIRGELVGINTAIFSTTGGYQGIGFAIPSNMAKSVMESLMKKGRVVRGWLGVTIQPLTEDLAVQFNITEKQGILVGDVTEDSPAERAGILRGDVITKFNGKEVKDVTTLRNAVANTPPDSEVNIQLISQGKIKSVKVTILEMPAETQSALEMFNNLLDGVSVQSLTPSLRGGLNIPGRITGVVITGIRDDSAAEGILLQNDVIMEVNRQKIGDVRDYERVVSNIKADENILILIFRKNSTVYIPLSQK